MSTRKPYAGTLHDQTTPPLRRTRSGAGGGRSKFVLMLYAAAAACAIVAVWREPSNPLLWCILLLGLGTLGEKL